jgi:hypothetical protein
MSMQPTISEGKLIKKGTDTGKDNKKQMNAVLNRSSSSKCQHLNNIFDANVDGSILDVQNRNNLKNLIIDQEKFANLFSDGLEITPDINQDDF